MTSSKVAAVSPHRVLGAVAFGAWAFLFWFLLASDRVSLYLSSRTSWVVPVGAVVLSVGVVGRVLTLRTTQPERLNVRDGVGFAAVVVPVVVVLSLPPAALGSFAAARRSSVIGGGFVASVGDIAEGDLSLADIAGAVRSRETMAALTQRAGEEVSFIGFVAREPGMGADEFMLTRFLISCCVADALSVQVRVTGAPPARFQPDDWVRVTGAMYPLGRDVVIDASEVVEVSRPKHPYLNP